MSVPPRSKPPSAHGPTLLGTTLILAGAIVGGVGASPWGGAMLPGVPLPWLGGGLVLTGLLLLAGGALAATGRADARLAEMHHALREGKRERPRVEELAWHEWWRVVAPEGARGRGERAASALQFIGYAMRWGPGALLLSGVVLVGLSRNGVPGVGPAGWAIVGPFYGSHFRIVLLLIALTVFSMVGHHLCRMARLARGQSATAQDVGRWRRIIKWRRGRGL